jgi:hypothetical protein
MKVKRQMTRSRSVNHNPASWDCVDCGRNTAPGGNYAFLKSIGAIPKKGNKMVSTPIGRGTRIKTKRSVVFIPLVPPKYPAEMYAP